MESITFSHGKLLEGSFIAYICGVEIPVVSVQVHLSVGGQEPTALVTMTPDPLITRLGAEDRVEIQVFYLDPFYPEVQKVGKPSDFRLLFEGEILGWSYTNSPRGRTMALTCGNFLRILSDLQPVHLTGPESFAMNMAANPTGNTAATPTNSLTFPWSIFFYGINQNVADPNKLEVGKEDGLIRRPYDLIMNILNSVVGVDANNRLGSVISPNFFGRYMKRIAFPHRFVPSPIIETNLPEGEAGVFPILKAIRDNSVLTALARGAMDMGQNAPIWAALQQMFLQMYYETLAITTAPIAQVNRIEKDPNNGSILGPPKFMLPVDIEKEKQAAAAQEIMRQNAIEEARQAAYALAVQDMTADVSVDEAGMARIEETAKQMGDAAAKATEKANPQKPQTPTQPNCILNYITKPQWIFGIAPACNVIFPSMIQEMHFEENFWAQPTRMYLTDMTYAEFFNADSSIIMNLAAMRGGYPAQVQHEIDKRYGIGTGGNNFDLTVSGKNFLVWPEEFYRGPRSAQIRLPRWFMMLTQYTQTQQTVEQGAAAKAQTDLKKAVALGTPEEKKLAALQASGAIPKEIKTAADLEKLVKAQIATETDSQKAFRRAYSRYEYYRQRGEHRAGAVILMFNPYLVPGYTIVVFDDLASGQNFIAYATDVRHELSTEGWTTVVNYICGQSLDEFLHELFDAKVGNSKEGRAPMPELGSAPPYPIDEIRNTMQVLENAETYFSLLFHQGQHYPDPTGNVLKRCAFDITDAIELVLPSGEAVAFSDAVGAENVQREVNRRTTDCSKDTAAMEAELAEYESLLRSNLTSPVSADEEKFLQEQVEAQRKFLEQTYAEKRVITQNMTPQQALASGILSKYVAVRPSKKFALIFGDFQNAMRFVSRPICTLEEYIAFRGSRGTREGTILATNPIAGKGGTYYERILNFKPGPGDPPEFDEENRLVKPLMADLPDTRIDWVPRLKAYRAKVTFKKTGQRPDTPRGAK